MRLETDETEKHVVAMAPSLVGNRLVSYHLVNYIFKQTKVVIPKLSLEVWLFGITCLIIDKDLEGNIINIQINKKGYIQKKFSYLLLLLQHDCFFSYFFKF